MNKILAFDCAGSVIMAYAENGKKKKTVKLEGSGTENLMCLIDECLNAVGLEVGDIELVCVGVGPGSWTGARVAVTTALGLAAGQKHLKFAIFNSFDLLSYNGSEQKSVVKLVKAYANFVYVQYDGKIAAITKDELFKTCTGRVWIAAESFMDDVVVVEPDIENAIKTLKAGKHLVDPSEIEPMYLRLSQAEYQRMNKSAGGK